MKRSIFCLGIAVAFAFSAVGCREEGPAEKAGRAVDEAMEELAQGGEGAVEEAGRQADEAIEKARKAVQE